MADQTTLVDDVFHRILKMVIEGEVPPGGAINELALASRFNTSRGPVREAVKRMQGTGLISKEPYLKARVVQLSVEDMIEVFQLREAAEGMAVRLATKNMSDDAVDILLSDFSNPVLVGNGAETDVHVRIAEGCGNERIRALLCDELYYLLRLFRSQSGRSPGRREDAHLEHWQILRAIKSRDAELAESLMHAHISRAEQRLRDLMAEPTQTNSMSANQV